MSKRIWYSKPLSEMWSQYNKFYKLCRGTVDEFYFEKNKQIFSTPNQKPEDIQSHTSILDLWRLDIHKKFIHIYFKQKELRDFLQNMKLADLNGITDFLYNSGETFYFAPSLDTKKYLGKPEKIQTYSFGIHIPYEKEEKGYAFQLCYNEKKELDLVWAVGNNEGWISAETYEYNLKNEGEHSDFFVKIFRLAVNTIAYMKVFPECVTEGVPPTEKERLAYTLDISEKVIEPFKNQDSVKTVVPHFRKGYLKRLSSDYYTHKKGQIIFVSETMVNGIAKTVEKSQNENKLKEFAENT